MATNNQQASALYRMVWRWHFYAGIFCIPFVILLSITGAIYLFKPFYENWQESRYHSTVVEKTLLPANQQIHLALASIPNSHFLSYRLATADQPAVLINLQQGDVRWQVWINPSSGKILATQKTHDQLMEIIKTIHGELLLGDVGSILVELAACWAIVLIISGCYLWWPRQLRGIAGIFYPRLRQGSRIFWRDIHSVTGIWISALALFLLITGLPWAMVWGSTLKDIRTLGSALTQPADWSVGRQQEQQLWRAQAVSQFNLTPEVISTATQSQLAPPVELSLANAQSNLWKASSQHPNRTVRSDAWIQSTGEIKQTAEFSEKAFLDRAIGVGISAHEGQLFGTINIILGVLTCVGLVVVSSTGFILWLKRKPPQGLGALPRKLNTTPKSFIFIVILLMIFLPLLAISVILILCCEFFIFRRIGFISNWLGISENK